MTSRLSDEPVTQPDLVAIARIREILESLEDEEVDRVLLFLNHSYSSPKKAEADE